MGRDPTFHLLGRALAQLGDVFAQEIIKQRSDGRDCRELSDVLPRWRDDATNDVGGQLELEPQQEPSSKTRPNPFAFLKSCAVKQG